MGLDISVIMKIVSFCDKNITTSSKWNTNKCTLNNEYDVIQKWLSHLCPPSKMSDMD